jgi:signal transduction histidine kinase
VVLVSAAVLLIGAFAASMISESDLDELAVLYVVPVMLAGLELGVRGGGGGAAVALVLLLVASGRQSELTPVGLAASVVVFLIAGVLAGRFSERMRAGRYRQERLLASGLRLARLDNLDALPAVLAEELEQALDLASVWVRLRGLPAVEVGSPAGATLRVPISAHGIDYGSVTLGLPAGRFFGPEDRVVAAKLALQAGVAVDNQRLLASERERAALHAELEHTRTRLASHLRNVGQILGSEEAERREIARELHEQAAQAMAGVLFGLHVLERDLNEELTRKQLEEVSDIARGTLADLRQLAVSLRPPSLDDLGVRVALEGIAEREGTRGERRVTLDCAEFPRHLAPDVETCVYHLVQDAIRALDGSLTVKLNVDHDRDTLRIEVSGHSDGPDERFLAKLATAQARLELIGGTLRTSSHGTGRTDIHAELPLSPTPDTPPPLGRAVPTVADPHHT